MKNPITGRVAGWFELPVVCFVFLCLFCVLCLILFFATDEQLPYHADACDH